MKNIPCKLPNPNIFNEKLYVHFKGKVCLMFFFIFPMWSIPFAHYMLGITQYWTLFIISLAILYTVIPTTWYMNNVYRNFLLSCFGGLFSSITIGYSAVLFLLVAELNMPITIMVITSIILLITAYAIEFYCTYKNVFLYQKFLKNSINKEGQLDLQTWFKTLEGINSNDFAESKIIYIVTALGIPIIMAGSFNPLVSARVLLNNGEETFVSLVIALGLILISLLCVMPTINTLLQMIAFWKLEQDDFITKV